MYHISTGDQVTIVAALYQSIQFSWQVIIFHQSVLGVVGYMWNIIKSYTVMGLLYAIELHSTLT